MFSYPTPHDVRTAGYAMVADRFLLVIDHAVGADQARRIWEAVETPGVLLEDVLEIIVGIGVESVPGFALLELVDAPSSAVALAVRGTATVDLHGSQHSRYVGGGIRTWVEGSAKHVARISLGLGSDTAGDGETLPLVRGVVRADRLNWVAAGAAPAAAEPATGGAVPASSPSSAVPSWAVGADPNGTLAVDREALAAFAQAAAEQANAARDAVPAAAPVTPQAPRTLALRLADRIVPLDQPVVLGRNPRAAQHPGMRVEVLPSPRREISQTHLEVRLEGEELVVRDLDATNGTIVRAPDGQARLLRDGAAVRVVTGTLLDIGDGAVALFGVV